MNMFHLLYRLAFADTIVLPVPFIELLGQVARWIDYGLESQLNHSVGGGDNSKGTPPLSADSP
jgi:hypothetical protein